MAQIISKGMKRKRGEKIIITSWQLVHHCLNQTLPQYPHVLLELITDYVPGHIFKGESKLLNDHNKTMHAYKLMNCETCNLEPTLVLNEYLLNVTLQMRDVNEWSIQLVQYDKSERKSSQHITWNSGYRDFYDCNINNCRIDLRCDSKSITLAVNKHVKSAIGTMSFNPNPNSFDFRLIVFIGSGSVTLE
jgi:hypothetical protein